MGSSLRYVKNRTEFEINYQRKKRTKMSTANERFHASGGCIPSDNFVRIWMSIVCQPHRHVQHSVKTVTKRPSSVSMPTALASDPIRKCPLYFLIAVKKIVKSCFGDGLGIFSSEWSPKSQISTVSWLDSIRQRYFNFFILNILQDFLYIDFNFICQQ